MTEELNPKAAAAAADASKVRLDLLEVPADEAIANVLDHGAQKYGVENYRAIPIHLRTYIAATRRHLNALKRGEDIDPDSGESHWAHIGANVHVVMGAMDENTLVDDRGPGEPKQAGIDANQARTGKPDADTR